MIQSFFPRNTLDKGEFVYCRFDAVGDSPSYPIVQMPFITQSDWQKRVITSITCLGENDADVAGFTALLKATTPLFRNYSIMIYSQLSGYCLTLKNAGNTIILDNMPLPLLSNFTNPAMNLCRQKKTTMNVSLDNSFITRHADATPSATTVVIPFYIQYK